MSSSSSRRCRVCEHPGAVEAGLTTPASQGVPTAVIRLQLRAALQPVSASRRRQLQWHSTIRQRVRLARRPRCMAIHVPAGRPTVLELEHAGMPLLPHRRRKNLSEAVRGHMSNFGKDPVPRACAAGSNGTMLDSHALWAGSAGRSRNFYRISVLPKKKKKKKKIFLVCWIGVRRRYRVVAE